MARPSLIVRLIIFACLCAASALLLPRVRFDSILGLELPPDSPEARAALAAFEPFERSEGLVIGLARGEGSEEALGRLDAALRDAFQGDDSGCQILSALSASRLAGLGGAEPGAQVPGETPGGRAASALEGFFSSRDGARSLIHLNLPPGADQDEVLKKARAAIPQDLAASVELWGSPLSLEMVRQRIMGEMLRLVPLCALIILIALCLISRDVLIGLALWASCLAPALMAMALQAIFRLPFRSESVMIPIAVLSLSTSYAIQVYEHAGLGRGGWESGAGGSPTGIVLGCGLTAISGYASILTSDIQAMRSMAWIIIAGILIALATALLILAPLLESLKRMRPFSLAPRPLYGRLGRGGWAGLGAIGLAILLGFGASLVRVEGETLDGLFRRSDPMGTRIKEMTARYGGPDELELAISLPGDYPLVDADNFQAFLGLERSIAEAEGTASVLDYAAIVDWAFRALNEGIQRAPATPEEIGETMEIIQSAEGLPSLDALVDPTYSRARLLVRYGGAGAADEGEAAYLAYRDRIIGLAKAAFPSASIHAGGYREDRIALARHLNKGSWFSLAALFGLLAILMGAFFRSPLKALAGLAPAAMGSLAFFGIMGYASIPLGVSVATAFGVMGVAVDDAIHLIGVASGYIKAGLIPSRAFRKSVELTGSSIVLTAAVLGAGFSPLLICAFVPIGQAAFLSIAGVIVAALTSLMVLPSIAPALLRLGFKARGRKRKRAV
jgi:predicted RND superfamily exporter protein